MPLIQELDYGTPAVTSTKTVTLNIDGHDVTVPEGTSIMRAAMEAGIKVPKLCATDLLNSFGSCRLCLVEIEGPPRHAGLLHHARRARHEGAHRRREGPPHPPRRDGTVYLRPSARLPDLCAANGNCELQDAAGEVGLRDVRYGYDGANHLAVAGRRVQPIFPVRSGASASCARAACGRARKCRGPSR